MASVSGESCWIWSFLVWQHWCVCGNPQKNSDYETPCFTSMSCLPYLDSFWDGGQVAVQLQIYVVLLSGAIQSSFSLERFVKVVQPYNSTDTTAACKNSRFIIKARLDFNMIYNLYMLFLCVCWLRFKKMRYCYRGYRMVTNFRGLSFNMEMAISWLKHMNSTLSELTKKRIPLPACFRPCSDHSASTSVLARGARSSAQSTSVKFSQRYHLFFSLFLVW